MLPVIGDGSDGASHEVPKGTHPTYSGPDQLSGIGSGLRSATNQGLAGWSPTAALFVGADGNRITRGTPQYRLLGAFRRAGIDAQRARGALVHGLRHTFATELANSDVNVYVLMNLLGHESMATSQRYVTAAGTETRQAAAQNRLYRLMGTQR
jgi:integrase/recombinase XerC